MSIAEIGLSAYPPIFEEIFLRNLSYEIISLFRYLNNVKMVHLVNFTEIDTLKNGWRMYLRDGVFGIQHPLEAIDVRFTTHFELSQEMKDIIGNPEHLVAETYRLDANALPGNELWVNKVSTDHFHPSFDVRHSSIPFGHNPHINKTRLRGNNLRIYGHGTVFNWTRMYNLIT